MVNIEPGTSAYVEGYGTLGVYNTEEDAKGAEGNLLIPTENLAAQYWSDSSSSGSMRAMETNTPSIYAVNSRAPGVTDPYLMSQNYSDAYEDATGNVPGALPVLFLFVLYLVVALSIIIAAVAVACAIIAASTVNTSEQTTDPQTGHTIYRSCIGTPIGGVKCVYYDAYDKTTSDAGALGGMNDALTAIIIGAVAIGGIYIASKVLPGMLNKSKGKG